ncbi:MAG: DUF4783 domain-containing protein [Flavobacteriales bacterium]|jgi:hypothetical protein
MNTLLSTLFLVTMGFLANAQSDITPMVAEALKKGDAIAISTMMMPQVELEVDGKEGTFSSGEAKTILSQFFTANPPRDFTLKHQGTSKLDDQYRIGDLLTSKGTFRVTFFMKKGGWGMQIKQMKIEAPDAD